MSAPQPSNSEFVFHFFHETARFCHYFTDCDPPLTSSTQEWILRDLSEALPDFNIRQYFSSQPTIFEDYDCLVLSVDKQTNKIVGLVGSRWLESSEVKCLYIWTAVVGHEYRSTKLFPEMMQVHFNRVVNIADKFPTIVATKTYNPVVYRLLDLMFCKTEGVAMYPNLFQRQIPARLQDIAGKVAKMVAPTLEYDIESSTVYGGQAAVAPDFFPYMQKTNVACVWDHFSKHLSRNDQILCVIEISDADAEQNLLRRNKWDRLGAI